MMQLLKACLHPDAAKRPTAEELMTFPYFSGVQDVLPAPDRANRWGLRGLYAGDGTGRGLGTLIPALAMTVS